MNKFESTPEFYKENNEQSAEVFKDQEKVILNQTTRKFSKKMRNLILAGFFALSFCAFPEQSRGEDKSYVDTIETIAKTNIKHEKQIKQPESSSNRTEAQQLTEKLRADIKSYGKNLLSGRKRDLVNNIKDIGPKIEEFLHTSDEKLLPEILSQSNGDLKYIIDLYIKTLPEIKQKDRTAYQQAVQEALDFIKKIETKSLFALMYEFD